MNHAGILESSLPPSPCFIYRSFGTHVITGGSTGSRMNLFAKAKSSSSYTEKQFQAKLCIGFETGKASSKMCNGVSQSTIEESKNLEIHITKRIMGGNPDSTDPVKGMVMSGTSFPADSDVTAFMAQADNGTYPIFYTLVSIWDTLSERPEADDAWKSRAKNLNALIKSGFNNDPSWRPEGSWSITCNKGNFDATTGIFRASCDNNNTVNPRQLQDAKVNIYLCAPNARIHNKYGRLACDGLSNDSPSLPSESESPSV